MYRRFMMQPKINLFEPRNNKHCKYLEINCVDVEFGKTNIKDHLLHKIDEYIQDKGYDPTHLYINYEGYKAIFHETSDEDYSLEFVDTFMGLKIVMIPDNLRTGIYAKVDKFISNKDLFIEMMTQRVKKGEKV